jgi:hypothetical protein
MSWRLEPSPRSVGIEEGLAARVHDPLWLLARQWQLGEFNGKDAGTPAIVQIAGTSTVINAWRGAKQAAWSPFDAATTPLDSLVEPEDQPTLDLRERIEAGAHFLRMLAAAGLVRYAQAFVTACAFDAHSLADPAFSSDLMLMAVARRTADGLALQAIAVQLAASGPSAVPIEPGDIAAVQNVAIEWLAWYTDEMEPSPGSGTAVTWQENRLEYGFAVSSPAAGGTVLAADAYLGDGLDWYDFDIDPATAAADPNADAITISSKSVPAPVRYGGMPLPRFWAMEDAKTDFGSVEAAANDIGRLLLVEFATVYGNNWFVLPIKLAAGTLTILDSVVVSDVFGRNFLLSRAGADEPQWNLFSLDTKGGAVHPAQNALFLPPTAGPLSESKAVESVLFLRDEVADLAFGVEGLVQDALQRVKDRRACWVGHRTIAPGDPALPSYHVETIVPDYWIPLAPEQLPGQQSIRLRMVPMEVDDGGMPRLVEPQGLLLAPAADGSRLWLFDEEVPREGTQVDRVHRYARWLNGRSVTWTARHRQTGSGEGSSGLRYDFLTPE